MPELPDLEVFSRSLQKKLAGKKLVTLTIQNKSKLKDTEASFKKSLAGSTLKKVYREGKELRFAFGNGKVLGMHLMLKGKLKWLEKKNEEKNTILELLFNHGIGVALTDYQGIAAISLNPKEQEAPDALSKELNYDYLKNILSKKRTTIKNVLLDQKIIRGIGNAYADEILWKARISPFSVGNKIPDDKIKLLVKAIPSVLKDAIEQIAKIDPDIISGEIRDFLKIHNSKNKKSAGGAIIHNKMLNSRITYYTDEQKLYN